MWVVLFLYFILLLWSLLAQSSDRWKCSSNMQLALVMEIDTCGQVQLCVTEI